MADLDLSSLDGGLARRVEDSMARVERELRMPVVSDYTFVSETSAHLVQAGGKRFRPLLTLLSAEFGDALEPRVISAAVVVELTHLATLYHDDVMDEAELRRGAASANARWDNSVAILTGDFLFSRASNLLADLGPEAVRIQASTFERLVVGQIKETVGPTEGMDPVEHYLSVVADKTGSLIATSGRFGALMAGASPEVVAALATFGERIGVAFQLADDLLDVRSESTALGKTPGTDLREGVRTLPVLHALASPDPSDEELQSLLARDLSNETRHARALKLLRASDAMERAQSDLERYAAEARSLLEPLPQGTARNALEALCDLVVSRTG